MQIILKSRVDHARANISIYTMDLTTLNGPNRVGAIDLLKLEKQGLYMQTLQKRVKHAVGIENCVSFAIAPYKKILDVSSDSNLLCHLKPGGCCWWKRQCFGSACCMMQ
jgi:hypothetical protein